MNRDNAIAGGVIVVPDKLALEIATKINYIINGGYTKERLLIGKIMLSDYYGGNVEFAREKKKNKSISLRRICSLLDDPKITPGKLSVMIRMAIDDDMLRANFKPDVVNKIKWCHRQYLVELDTDEQKIESVKNDIWLPVGEIKQNINKMVNAARTNHSVTNEKIFRDAIDGLKSLGYKKKQATAQVASIKPLFDVHEAFTIEEVLEAAISGKRKVKAPPEPVASVQVDHGDHSATGDFTTTGTLRESIRQSMIKMMDQVLTELDPNQIQDVFEDFDGDKAGLVDPSEIETLDINGLLWAEELGIRKLEVDIRAAVYKVALLNLISIHIDEKKKDKKKGKKIKSSALPSPALLMKSTSSLDSSPPTLQ
jgi:hypothetical protein